MMMAQRLLMNFRRILLYVVESTSTWYRAQRMGYSGNLRVTQLNGGPQKAVNFTCFCAGESGSRSQVASVVWLHLSYEKWN